MKNIDFHDTMYEPNGGVLMSKDPANIILQKRYSSVVYTPKFDERRPGSMYPRCIVLNHNEEKNGALLATFECYTNDIPVFPIYESLDDGKSWHFLSQIEDKETNWGCRYQPHLFELPCQVGDLPAGAILCAGNIIPNDFTITSLRLYVSLDGGKTWAYRSEIDKGAVAMVDPENGTDRPIWEPFIELTKDGDIIIFYSDERFKDTKKWNQMLAHKVSKDGGLTWGEEVVDIAYADGNLRPGMPIVTRMGDGTYAIIYEMVNQDGIPCYFRLSSDIEDWGEVDFMGNPIKCADGSYITGTPYILWIPQGGKEGTLLASGRAFGHIMANSNGGKGFWKKMPRLAGLDNTCGFVGYSQCLVALHGGKQILNLVSKQIAPDLAQIECVVADVYEKTE